MSITTLTETSSVTVRLPDELRRWLEETAEREHRTLSGQVRFLLEHALQEEEKPSKRKGGKGE